MLSVWSAYLQALVNVINDTLGAPLFDVKTALAGLPLSAAIKSIRLYPGQQVVSYLALAFQPFS